SGSWNDPPCRVDAGSARFRRTTSEKRHARRPPQEPAHSPLACERGSQRYHPRSRRTLLRGACGSKVPCRPLMSGACLPPFPVAASTSDTGPDVRAYTLSENPVQEEIVRYRDLIVT